MDNLFASESPDPPATERHSIVTRADLTCESCGHVSNKWSAEMVGPHIAAFCGGCGARYLSNSYWMPLRAIKDWK